MTTPLTPLIKESEKIFNEETEDLSKRLVNQIEAYNLLRESFNETLWKIKEKLGKEISDKLFKSIGMQGFNREWKQPEGKLTYWEIIDKIINSVIEEFQSPKEKPLAEAKGNSKLLSPAGIGNNEAEASREGVRRSDVFESISPADTEPDVKDVNDIEDRNSHNLSSGSLNSKERK